MYRHFKGRILSVAPSTSEPYIFYIFKDKDSVLTSIYKNCNALDAQWFKQRAIKLYKHKMRGQLIVSQVRLVSVAAYFKPT